MDGAPLGPVVLVAVVVLAGCSGPFVGSDPGQPETATLTPAPVPADQTPTPRATELAPGLTAAGIVDAARLVTAHGEARTDTSYTARLSTRRAAPNGTVRERYDRTLRVASPDRFRYVLTADAPAVDRRTDRWRDGDRAYEAVTRNGTTTYRTLDAPTVPTLLSQEGLLRLFRVLPSRVTGTRTANGTTAYRVVGGPRDLPPLSNVTYTAVVTERGLITAYSVTYDVDRGDRPRAVTVEANVHRVGETTVERPPWYDEAT